MRELQFEQCTGPKDAELRKARVCYNHLAGDLGVKFYDKMILNGYLFESNDDVSITSEGEQFVIGFGIDLSSLLKNRRPLCKSCLDWSSRRTHLAESLGTAFLERFYQLGWAKRSESSRFIVFSEQGEIQLFSSLEI